MTRRHLTEYVHIEAEVPFIDFEDLLSMLEDLLIGVCQRLFDTVGDEILAINKDFKVPKAPFRRIRHSEAIAWLQEQNYHRSDGSGFQIGQDIPEPAERFLVDTFGEPILLTHMPTKLKWIYVKPDPTDPTVSLSVDLLVPGVGEILGASIRIDNEQQLMDNYKRHNVDSTPYYWYTQQRKFGTCPHGGYGVGFERMLTWILGKYTVCDACLYPRVSGRSNP